MRWISENLGSILVFLVLVCIVVLIVRQLISDRKHGRSSCGSGCASCPMSGSCHRHK